MRKQEEQAYKYVDYIQAGLDKGISVDATCRDKLASWCYQVIDYCKFNRDTMSISMSYLDRFLGTKSGTICLSDPREYQLAAITTLYMAIKVQEPVEVDTSLLSDLSRGSYGAIEFANMESRILSALQWYLNGPTPVTFVKYFLSLLPKIVHSKVRSSLLDYARFQTELAVSDYFLSVRCKPSVLALAAIRNSLDCFDYSCLSKGVRRDFISRLEHLCGHEGSDVDTVAIHLSALFSVALDGEKLGSRQESMLKRKSDTILTKLEPQKKSSHRARS
eukprot:CAMPEP_0118690654 /NCGR_PEP_ID=MMETSP0800-20121206/10238_1 /TAXON_ID=210618 ORGANISM="Striatella unipunctata, Strain CCMP2910" /NCGR_SAMPLE_ID=MMETSP0800 /ASSEMBLY_ACC=CAM_ASM_000638 /LENGTH=275 /DNA_ID=CAMNT_0006588333 /DNA_START=53 /DNA_END=877 /DNA_ORIENTATION=+